MWFSNRANIMVVLSAGWILWNKIGIRKGEESEEYSKYNYNNQNYWRIFNAVF